jgi:hypothetical protein
MVRDGFYGSTEPTCIWPLSSRQWFPPQDLGSGKPAATRQLSYCPFPVWLDGKVERSILLRLFFRRLPAALLNKRSIVRTARCSDRDRTRDCRNGTVPIYCDCRLISVLSDGYYCSLCSALTVPNPHPCFVFAVHLHAASQRHFAYNARQRFSNFQDSMKSQILEKGAKSANFAA